MGMIWQKLMVAEAAPAGYSCTITIGDVAGVVYGYEVPNFGIGSIDAEPITGEVMLGCYWEPGSSVTVTFQGDVTGLVGSLDVWLGGVNYGGSGDWSFSGDTGFENLTTGPSNTSGTILLEIK